MLLVAASAAVTLAGCGSSSTQTMTGVVVTDDPGTGGGSSGCFIPNWPGPGQFSPDISSLQVVVVASNGTVLGTGNLGQPSIKPLPGSQTGYEQCFYSFQISGLPSEARYGVQLSPSNLGTIWIDQSGIRNVVFNRGN
jgi:hypothetical protein